MSAGSVESSAIGQMNAEIAEAVDVVEVEVVLEVKATDDEATRESAAEADLLLLTAGPDGAGAVREKMEDAR